MILVVTAPTSTYGRITTTHELTQAVPPRPQIVSWCSVLTRNSSLPWGGVFCGCREDALTRIAIEHVAQLIASRLRVG